MSDDTGVSSTPTRAEHMAWCKERALAELDAAGPTEALASICSDLHKHPETKLMAAFAGAAGPVHTGDVVAMRRFIEGFA